MRYAMFAAWAVVFFYGAGILLGFGALLWSVVAFQAGWEVPGSPQEPWTLPLCILSAAIGFVLSVRGNLPGTKPDDK